MLGLNECRSEIIRLIAKGDVSAAVLSVLADGDGLVSHETEIWDYKREVGEGRLDLAELARDVISFHNSFGGYIIVGIADGGGLVGSSEISSQQVRQVVKTYSGLDLAVICACVEYGGVELCLIYIPKRLASDSPSAISRQGPESSKGKVIFKPGDIFFRSDDSSQLIRGSDDLRFLIGARRHSSDTLSLEGVRVISNNLPDRSVVFSKFFGRDDVKNSLWEWLADPFSKYRVVAGAGGIGKTSAVYSFCEELCADAPLDLEQVVWISAKSKQFNAISDRSLDLPYLVGSRQFGQSFQDFETLLDALSFHLAITDDEWEGCGFSAKKMAVISALGVVRSIVIVDDLDSLDPDDQRTAVEFAMSLPSGGSRVVFTTRKNYLAPAASTYELNGLDAKAYEDYVGYLQGLHSRRLNSSEIRTLKGETGGSPLFIESVFRLLRLGERFGEAVARWKGVDGEAVRSACFQREIGQLSFGAKKVIFSLAQFESASSTEVKHVAEMQTSEVESAIQELHGLFLIQSKEIAGEARFSVPSSLKMMLGDIKTGIPNWSEISRRAKDLRRDAKRGVSRSSDREVALSIQQAMGHLGSGDAPLAIHTIKSALVLNPNNADLEMVYARCLSRSDSLDVASVRKAFQRSFDLGKREPQLFLKWVEFEVDHGSANAAIDVIGKAVSISEDDWRWLSLTARAFSKRASEREDRREWTDAMADLVRAAGCAARAIQFSPGSAKPSIIAIAQLVNDSRWRVSGRDQASSLEARVRIGIDAVRKGDRREVCLHRIIDLLEREVVSQGKAARGGKDVPRWLSDAVRLLDSRSSGRARERFESLSLGGIPVRRLV